VKIAWDDAKRQANLAKHGLDFASLDLDFFAAALIIPARSPRIVAIGRTASNRTVTVIFSPLGSEALSVILMRPASRKERSRLNAS
jgi:uncharacterized DUF497 family protein